jgi:hypothetical protein
MERLWSNVPTYRFVAQLHYETSDARVVLDHLYERLPVEVSSVARHYREENLLFFAKVEGGVLLPEIQKSLDRSHRRIGFLSLRCLPEPTGLYQTVVVILRKSPQFWGALHRVSLPLSFIHRLTSITKTRRLYQRLYAFPIWTCSITNLQRILPSVEVEVGDYVGGPIIEKLMPSAKESRRADSNR